MLSMTGMRVLWYRLHVETYADAQEFSVRTCYPSPSWWCSFCPRAPLTSSTVPVWQWGLYTGLSVEAAVDLIIAITQVLLLRRLETGIPRCAFPQLLCLGRTLTLSTKHSMDSVLHVLMAYSVNTGLLTRCMSFARVCTVC